MSRPRSDWAIQTGHGLARNLSLTHDGRAAVKAEDDRLEREAAERRAALLRVARAELIGRVFKC